jgi:hypothetical protein
VGAPYLRGHFVLSSRARINYDFDKYPFESNPGVLRRRASVIAESVPPQTDRIGGWTSASDIARGVDVLYETVLRLDTLPASLGPASAGVNA